MDLVCLVSKARCSTRLVSVKCSYRLFRRRKRYALTDCTAANIQNISVLGERQQAVKWQNLRPVHEPIDPTIFSSLLADTIAAGPSDVVFPTHEARVVPVPTIGARGVVEARVPSVQRRAAHEQSLRQLSKKNLQDRAKEYGLTVRGDVKTLINRILDYLDRV